MQDEYISELPEACISTILSLTSPRDACTSSLLSRTFKFAADSDAVWEKFLPADYEDIIARSVPLLDMNQFGSKKELYFKLCDDPILIDGGSTSISLEKKSGKKCVIIGARQLRIVSSDDDHSWAWIFHEGSRFPEVAQLISICLLRINGYIDTRMLSKETTYMVYIVVKFTEDAYGLDHRAVEVSVFSGMRAGIASGTRKAYLDPLLRERYEWTTSGSGFVLGPISLSESLCQFPRARADGWLEVVMGEFYNDDEGGWVDVTLDETRTLQWKNGLIVQGIEVRPK